MGGSGVVLECYKGVKEYLKGVTWVLQLSYISVLQGCERAFHRCYKVVSRDITRLLQGYYKDITWVFQG